ncbi:MAG: extracellular solute-binding protein, partial [Firmicutes bacterium]|nr:extracellular solute-binding protein [Bacillota bacterium]
MARFEEEFGVKVQHPAVPDVHEMLYRLGPLNRTNEDVIHIVAINAVPRVAQFLTPLDEYLETKPIDGWPEDWPEGMINNFKIDGKQYAVPVGAGTFCLWYNQKVFEPTFRTLEP